MGLCPELLVKAAPGRLTADASLWFSNEHRRDLSAATKAGTRVTHGKSLLHKESTEEETLWFKS